VRVRNGCAWLAERRAALAAAYDAEAATYGDEEYPSDMQREWVARVLGLIPPGGTVLDAPCGTGKYFAVLAAAGHRVAGADQSAGMLARARARGIAFSLQRTSLQDQPYAARFDAVLTIEAMQHIPPEDWPGVLANLHRAVRPGDVLYLTVEELEQHHIERAFESLSARGLRGAGRRHQAACRAGLEPELHRHEPVRFLRPAGRARRCCRARRRSGPPGNTA